MKKNLLNTLLAAIAVMVSISTAFAQSSGGPNPVITEIMYNPPESSNDTLEFIEIYNPSSSSSIDMSGYYFSAGVTFTFPSGYILGAGEYVVVAGDAAIFQAAYGGVALQWEGAATQLNNNGEALALNHSAGGLVDAVTYDDVAPWPTGANGQGYSLVLCDPTSDNSLAANWTLSENNTGIVVNAKTIFADPGAAATCMSVGIDDDNVITTVVYPNPTNGIFNLNFATLASDLTLDMHNSLGQRVYSTVISKGLNFATIDADLRSGLYIITLTTGDATEQFRLVVE